MKAPDPPGTNTLVVANPLEQSDIHLALLLHDTEKNQLRLTIIVNGETVGRVVLVDESDSRARSGAEAKFPLIFRLSRYLVIVDEPDLYEKAGNHAFTIALLFAYVNGLQNRYKTLPYLCGPDHFHNTGAIQV